MGYILTFIGGMATMLIIVAVNSNKVYTQEEMDETIDFYEWEILRLKRMLRGEPPEPPRTRVVSESGKVRRG